jgi:hypothetical protein
VAHRNTRLLIGFLLWSRVDSRINGDYYCKPKL